jgi:hypothetical protein
VKRGQNFFFLKNNSPNGETLPKKEKLGQIRKRERERERERENSSQRSDLHAY